MKIRGIEIRKGDRMYLAGPGNDGYWEVKSLRPFRVAYHKDGRVWLVDDDSPELWVEDMKRFKVKMKGDKQ